MNEKEKGNESDLKKAAEMILEAEYVMALTGASVVPDQSPVNNREVLPRLAEEIKKGRR